MALSFFSIGKDKGDGDSDGGAKSGFKRDPRKAARFREHAQTVAEARNYDYAVECYINGLKHDPDNMDMHEALKDVAIRRKVGGGKPAGLRDKLSSGGSTAVDKMLHAEKLWAMDPQNVSQMLAVMKHGADANDAEADLNLGEVVYWLGEMVLSQAGQVKKPDVFIKVRDLFARVGAFAKAVEACRRAVQLAPNNSDLLAELKNLEAEATIDKGYGAGGDDEEGGEEGESFRKNIRDADKQRGLALGDAGSRTENAADELVMRRRAEYEEDPQDYDRMAKLVDALVARETNESEREAIDLLKQAWEQTGQYRYKMRVGDIQMKQINRYLRQLAAQIKERPDDEAVRAKYDEAMKKRLVFELGEFEERVKNYPTDMSLKFELGKRLFQTKRFDEAIGMFQQSKSDPKVRAASHMFLGSCFISQDWFDEAIATLDEGITNYQGTDDRMRLEMQYLLMDARERVARKNRDLDQAREAQKIASTIVQTDIGFRDIRDRMNALRSFVDELANGGKDDED